MANVRQPTGERVYSIRRWRGVNEAPEGEAALRMGEAAVMRNFRVTAGGALRKRPGSREVADLMSGYTAEADTSAAQTLLTELTSSTAQFQMYPGCEADSEGVLTLTGAPVTVTNANADSYTGYYYADGEGNIYRFAGLMRTDE